MRAIFLLPIVGVAVLPLSVEAQTTAPPISNPAAGPATTPAPVPSVPPGTPQTGAPSIPPEQIAPPLRGTANSSDTSMPNATPFSGPPPSLNPGTNQTTPRGGSEGPATPNLSR